MNPTIEKFGYPHTLVREYRRWVVLLRPAQATLGALVLASTEPARAFGEVSAEGFAELAKATADIEAALRGAFGCDKLNWLMLMMVDPDVHFHVLPRYAQAKTFAGLEFPDPGWPGPPRLDLTPAVDAAMQRSLVEFLRGHWPS